MVGMTGVRRAAAAATLLLASLGLTACAGDGVELNGKIFDAVGLSGDILGKKPEPKTQARAPLVLPPDPNRLPEPGGAPAPTANQDWPRDAQQQRVAEATARKQAQAKFCSDGNWKEKAMKDDIAASRGPDGTCQGSIFSLFSGSKTDED
jgi:hypothetical protein